ncbi:Fatty acid oxidation complex subunit alpha [Crateriforma conspicua]|uniref:Fatty acid oxidation complex subunit alpha n=1 Tax=Crateriforma conspicua TaxID=2527996 RepID=A0A5C6FQB5_9PLAN|nr:3-hydroxyacyl-CoA dehydrogenase family protein [Crateriforma conspicua]TWU62686.1 Fatty acid oxidation complex subunit alpha [Crateriforma conspicua]
MMRTVLVGFGVVGRAVCAEHLRRGIAVDVVDQDASALQSASEWLQHTFPGDDPSGNAWNIRSIPSVIGSLTSIRIEPSDPRDAGGADDWAGDGRPTLLIESVAENLEVKQALFRQAQADLPGGSIYCSNTSTLPIRDISSSLDQVERVVGMHFFMPVAQRPAVEIIASPKTDPAIVDVCADHVRRLGKVPLRVGDHVGFVVNRMLAPYINESITMLCRGATASQIADAAMQFGMPISPLALVDVIGTRTAFDGGRSYWRAFPDRFVSAPLLPALVKRKRRGRHDGGGFFDNQNDAGQHRLAPEVDGLVTRYTRQSRDWTVNQIHHRLAATLWAEAACLIRDGVVKDVGVIDDAMWGGLGYRMSLGADAMPVMDMPTVNDSERQSFTRHCDSLGWGILRTQWSGEDPIHVPAWLEHQCESAVANGQSPRDVLVTNLTASDHVR